MTCRVCRRGWGDLTFLKNALVPTGVQMIHGRALGWEGKGMKVLTRLQPRRAGPHTVTHRGE